MIQLVATSQDGTEQVQLDAPKIPIELNFQFQDLNDPFANRAPYSFNFNLPATRVNQKFFSFYFDYNVTLGTFKATKRASVVLYENGILVMSGILQLHKVDEETFTVAVYEDLATLFEEIKDLSWSQLFTTSAGTLDTDLDHSLNWSNIISSWTVSNDITTGQVGAGTIVYPLSDWGQNPTNNEGNEGISAGFTYAGLGTGIGSFNATYQQSLAAKNFKPAIRIQYLVKYIFEYAGFVYNSAFFDSADFKKIYMFLASETERVASRPSYGFRVGLTSSFTIPISNAGIFQSVTFDNESIDPFYDPDGLMANGTFSVPYEGNYLLASRLVSVVATPSSLYNYDVSVKYLVNGQTVANSYGMQCSSQAVNLVDHQYYLNLNAGDTVTVKLSCSNTIDATTFATSNSTGTSFWQLIQYTGSGGVVDVSANFPDVTVDEWLKAIFEKFNLRMTTDRDATGTLYVEPWNSWWDSGVKKDWTNKVDANSIVIEPSTKYQKKSLNFSDGEGADFVNEWWQFHSKRTKGQFIFENEDNDFAVGEQETSELFQPYRNRIVPTNIQGDPPSMIPNVLIPAFWNWHDGSNGSIYAKEFVACKPVLAYYNGLQSIGNGAQFNYGGTLSSNYPYFAQYNEVGVDENTLDLHWGYSYPDNLNAPFVGGGNTAGFTKSQLFPVYWQRMMNEIYSDQSRVLTCKISLNSADIYDLKFNDFLYIEGAYWKLISLTNYTLDNERLCNAELVKVIDASSARTSQSCNDQVDSFNNKLLRVKRLCMEREFERLFYCIWQ